MARACVSCALAACATQPAPEPPKIDIPAAWQTESPWHEAQPGDALPRGDWWQVFADADLDRLERDAHANSPTLAAAVARLDQARAQIDTANAGLLPTVNASASAARQRISSNRPLSNYAVPSSSTVQNDFRLGPSVSYEVDLSGRLHAVVEAARASGDVAAADLENARLLLAAQVATSYYALRELDAEIDVVEQSLALQKRALEFVTTRHDAGAASGLDLAQQQASLDGVTTQSRLLRNQRQQAEHALATLVGMPASAFKLAPQPSLTAQALPASPPIGLPSDVLQRRPDVASAQRAVAAANAQIGIAHAAYFPTLLLTPSGGWESNMLPRLIEAPSTFWSLGASLAGTLFDGGRRRANDVLARAGYDGAVANYRQSVLTAMQEVQNGISASQTLAQASAEAQAAVASAQRLLDLANARYSGGLATYLDVITAQQSLLTNQRTATQILGQQLQNSVFLVKALGGGWREERQALAQPLK